MKRIIALFNDHTSNQSIIESCLQIATLFDIEIVLCHLIAAPKDWEVLNRTQRDKYPNEKLRINEVRLYLDKQLADLRQENIKAKKKFLFYDESESPFEDDFTKDDLIISDVCLFNKHAELNSYLFNLPFPKLIIDKAFDIKDVMDIVFTSNFKPLKDETSEILAKLYSVLDFTLNLVFINTKEVQESSEISITNMKEVIASNHFSKTSISIFYSDRKLAGAKLFSEMKGGDLIIIESTGEISYTEILDLNLPLLIVNNYEG